MLRTRAVSPAAVSSETASPWERLKKFSSGPCGSSCDCAAADSAAGSVIARLASRQSVIRNGRRGRGIGIGIGAIFRCRTAPKPDAATSVRQQKIVCAARFHTPGGFLGLGARAPEQVAPHRAVAGAPAILGYDQPPDAPVGPKGMFRIE